MSSFLYKNLLEPFKELHYFFTYPIINWVITPPKLNPINDPKGTIVIVECWFQPNEYHKLWLGYLEKKGFKTHLITLTGMNEDFLTTARKLAKEIEKLTLNNYTLVGISTGALVCLTYLDHFKKWDDLKLFISLGGPLHGSLAAWLIAFTKKGRQMMPQSTFIQELLQNPIPKNKMVTLSASHDEFIPLKNSMIDGVPSHIIHVYGHNFFHLDHKNTYDLIARLAEKVS